ncbi:Uncharacterized protein TCM_018827 [Theobroma cacao]|uniref:RNase H type-1 domain-containing protein n=1 Tax=Theobroma cacao TaxID=3641 RepID=A0A061EN34_THECC|nr:Uncharacterized protein TCM_018827 [Theobroma cacao]
MGVITRLISERDGPGVLKERFSRIFTLGTNKEGCVCEFGNWSGDNWEWHVDLRRQPFGWEENQWEHFRNTVEECCLCKDMKDTLVWKCTASGQYSVKSYCKEVLQPNINVEDPWKEIWSGLVPFRIEVFVWQLLCERVAVKHELTRRGMITNDLAKCVEVKWVAPNDVGLFFKLWNNSSVKQGELKIWKMGFYTIAWSTWLQRNEMVFRGKGWDGNQVYEVSKLRVAIWAKTRWPCEYGTVLDTYRNPTLGVVIRKLRKGRTVDELRKSNLEEMKFNVDGVAQGCPGDAGIGGVMHDDKGQIKVLFSKSIGIGDSNLAEVKAIREAFLIFSASRWAIFHSLVIESDSQNVVK